MSTDETTGAPVYMPTWARKHALENPGHRTREGLHDPGSCDDCTARSPIYDLVTPPATTKETK